MTERSTLAIRTLAKNFIERAEALELKGKKRDSAALDFFCGAATLANAIKADDLAQHIAMVCAFLISIRGYVAVVELAGESDDDAA